MVGMVAVVAEDLIETIYLPMLAVMLPIGIMYGIYVIRKKYKVHDYV